MNLSSIFLIPAYIGHPAQTRAHVFQAAEQAGYHSGSFSINQSPSSPPVARGIARVFGAAWSTSLPPPEDAIANDSDSDEEDPLIVQRPETHTHKHSNGHKHDHDHARPTPDVESQNQDHSHSHSHGSMNMRALLLHVLGDALGNVGVIASGLIIWLTTWSWKYYSDPIISLAITCIIFTSALPLGELRSVTYI